MTVGESTWIRPPFRPRLVDPRIPGLDAAPPGQGIDHPLALARAREPS